MKDLRIRLAITIAEEFLRRARLCVNEEDPSPKETGALRRQSLELTRALAEMRRAR